MSRVKPHSQVSRWPSMHAGHHVLSHPRYIPWYLLSIMWLNPYNYDIPILYPGYILTKFPWNIMKHHETSPFTGWWFGINLFSTIYGIILSHWRTHIFQDGYIAPPTSDNPMVFLGHFLGFSDFGGSDFQTKPSINFISCHMPYMWGNAKGHLCGGVGPPAHTWSLCIYI
jgi:hypothetical protein